MPGAGAVRDDQPRDGVLRSDPHGGDGAPALAQVPAYFGRVHVRILPEMTGTLYVGTSGFSYDEWKHGVFYPEGLKNREMLAYYASRFPSVEINYTFRRYPSEKSSPPGASRPRSTSVSRSRRTSGSRTSSASRMPTTTCATS